MHNEDECPDQSVPNRSGCVPGYVARADREPAVWRCPSDAWGIHFDDPTLPFWGWRSIERMHGDANFVYGSIPPYLPDRWPNLRSLDLHDLFLTGVVPSSLLQLPNLTQLQLALNDLECNNDTG